MDSKRDGLVDWDEFVSHILLEFQEKENAATPQSLRLPLHGYPKMTRSNHKFPVLRVTFYPAVLPVGISAMNESTGFYHRNASVLCLIGAVTDHDSYRRRGCP
jgi:hypothetical protein